MVRGRQLDVNAMSDFFLCTPTVVMCHLKLNGGPVRCCCRNERMLSEAGDFAKHLKEVIRDVGGMSNSYTV